MIKEHDCVVLTQDLTEASLKAGDVGTVEVVQQHLDDPLALALAQDSMTETQVAPWYATQSRSIGHSLPGSMRRSRVALNRSRRTRVRASPKRFSCDDVRR
jgi:hypothetical protein